MSKLTRKDIENALKHSKKINPELNSLILHDADARCGKRVALAKKGELGTINVQTDFLSYPEMNQLLRGYNMKAENKFKS